MLFRLHSLMQHAHDQDAAFGLLIEHGMTSALEAQIAGPVLEGPPGIGKGR